MDSLFFYARVYFNSKAGVKVYTVLGNVPPPPERIAVSGKSASCQLHVPAISAGLFLSGTLNIADIDIHKWDSNQIEIISGVLGFFLYECNSQS